MNDRMAIYEVQMVEFVVQPARLKDQRKAPPEHATYDGFIRWRTESRHTGRAMVKAWLPLRGSQIDLTDELMSGKVSYRTI